ncbi:ABC-type bacteriocin/lantibiotic exporter with double-glycine peptidase domain [Rahnella inusitata]|nr:ABC-type bacteriocin/lantibiotic exporter with double-glycine peptidase domain [Rahnella inusitata]
MINIIAYLAVLTILIGYLSLMLFVPTVFFILNVVLGFIWCISTDKKINNNS